HTVEPKAVTASDPAPQRAKDLETRFGIHATTDNHAAADNAQIVILSVKPQMLRFVFRDLCGKLSKDSLVLSIVAGARVDSMMQGLKHPAIVRSMPNTPAQVGAGMTVWPARPAVPPLHRPPAPPPPPASRHAPHAPAAVLLALPPAITRPRPRHA